MVVRASLIGGGLAPPPLYLFNMLGGRPGWRIWTVYITWIHNTAAQFITTWLIMKL